MDNAGSLRGEFNSQDKDVSGHTFQHEFAVYEGQILGYMDGSKEIGGDGFEIEDMSDYKGVMKMTSCWR